MNNEQRERLRLILTGAGVGATITLAATSRLMSGATGILSAFGWFTFGLLLLIAVAVVVRSVR